MAEQDVLFYVGGELTGHQSTDRVYYAKMYDSHPRQFLPASESCPLLATRALAHDDNCPPVAASHSRTSSSMPAPLLRPYDLCWYSTKPMGTPRDGLCAIALQHQQQVMVMGGRHTRTILATTELYDARQDRWLPMALMKQQRDSPCVGSVSPGVLYVMGGSPRLGQYTASVERLDLRTGTWQSVSPLPRAASGMGCASWDGSLYVVGGHVSTPSDDRVPTMSHYDVRADRWDDHGCCPLNMGRSHFGAAFVDGASLQVSYHFPPQWYITGGYPSQHVNGIPELGAVERFDFITRQWEQIESLQRDDHASFIGASTFANGAIYALGGLTKDCTTMQDTVRVLPVC